MKLLKNRNTILALLLLLLLLLGMRKFVFVKNSTSFYLFFSEGYLDNCLLFRTTQKFFFLGWVTFVFEYFKVFWKTNKYKIVVRPLAVRNHILYNKSWA